MSNRKMAILVWSLSLLLLVGTVGDRLPVGGQVEEAYFQFDYPPDPETFIFKLTDPTRIQEAREMLAGRARQRHVMGRIVKQPADYNPPWSYHLEPSSIEFFDAATEVCDASIRYVEEHLDEACGAFLPGCNWCPWRSRLLAEVTPLPTPAATSTPTASVTASPTPAATATASATASVTASPLPAASRTPSVTVTATPLPLPAPFRLYLPLLRHERPLRSR